VQDAIHQGLERWRRIGETKRHNHELKVAVVSTKHHLGHIFGMHANLMISAPEVQLGEITRPIQLIQKLLHNRDGKLVLDRLSIECPIIDTKSPRPVLLLDQ
jgi:hypothetical protein